MPSSPCAAWILWIAPGTEPSLPGAVRECIERVRQTLEAVLEVEEREAHLFTSSSPLYDRDLIEALVHGDPHALSTFLSLTRVVAAADFAFWGSAYPDVVEVTSYLGAKHGGFGFALPRGHGVGGRVIAYGEPIALPDYRNSPYRHPASAISLTPKRFDPVWLFPFARRRPSSSRGQWQQSSTPRAEPSRLSPWPVDRNDTHLS